MPGGSRAVRTFGVRPVCIASGRLADENPLFGGLRNLVRRILCRKQKNAADPSSAVKGGSSAGDPPLKGNARRPSVRGSLAPAH